MKITVRPMKASEAGETVALMHRVIAETKVYNARARKGEIQKYDEPALLRKRATWKASVLVSVEAGVITGFCISEPQDGVLWIHWLGVSSAQRGKGIAKALMESLEKAARKEGFSKLWCDSRVDNTPVRVLLTSLRYETLCTIKAHWYGQDFMLWQKFIS